jgi:predicted Zn-dependent peptidase
VSSRLHQKFVKEKEIALSISAGPDERRGPSLFWLTVMARPGTDLRELETLIYEEIARVQNETIADWELDKVRMQLRRQRAQQLYSSRARANALGHYTVYYDNPKLINSVWDEYNRIGKADLQRVAASYFKETHRTVVTTMPKSKSAQAGRAAPVDSR